MGSSSPTVRAGLVQVEPAISNVGENQNRGYPMSDALESVKSAVLAAPAEPSRAGAARLREGTGAFLKQLFAHGHYLEESFRKICDDGCSREEFGTLLYVLCLVSSFRANSRYFPRGQERLVNSGNISKSQLKALPKKMRAMADTIDSLNATILAPANDIKLAPYDAQRQIARKYMIRRYETLPGLLRVYSRHLERFSRFADRTLKRLTPGHLHAIELLRYVEDHTGSPHYEDISNLLEEGWRVAGRTESTPRFLSAEGLAKLYQRRAESMCGPRRTSRS